MTAFTGLLATSAGWGHGPVRLGPGVPRAAATTLSSLVPSPSPTAALAAQVAVGTDSTCARLVTGAVKCWGFNNLGQLGTGDVAPRDAPPFRRISLGGRATDISVGGNQAHACAVLAGGALKCWGANQYGELGLAGRLSRLPPARTPIRLGGRARQVAAGYWFTCALLENGSVKCWGLNSSAELGDADWGQTHRTPEKKPIRLGGRGSQVAAGIHFACALLVEGTVKCWGDNEFGELGRLGPNLSRPSKNAIPLGERATQIAVGDSHACALLAGGTVKCWGDNSMGELDSKLPLQKQNARPVPIDVGGVATQISASGQHTCALLRGGKVTCWGLDDAGQLGQGSSHPLIAPPGSPVALPTAAIQIDTGAYVTCAIFINRTVTCWGANHFGNSDTVTTSTETCRPAAQSTCSALPADRDHRTKQKVGTPDLTYRTRSSPGFGRPRIRRSRVASETPWLDECVPSRTARPRLKSARRPRKTPRYPPP